MNTAGSVLLDTNVVVAHLRNDPDLTARLRATPAIYVPWVVLGELHYGAFRAKAHERRVVGHAMTAKDGGVGDGLDEVGLALPVGADERGDAGSQLDVHLRVAAEVGEGQRRDVHRRDQPDSRTGMSR